MPRLSPKHKHYEAIREKTKEVKLAYAEFCEAKEEARELKARSDRLNAQLIEFISRGPDLQMIIESLFEESPSGGEQGAASRETTDAAEAGAGEEQKNTPQPALPLCLPADHWRLRPVADLGLTDGLVDALKKHNLATIGALTDFWGAGHYLSEIKEIGLEHYQQVTDAFGQYVKRHPEVMGHTATAGGTAASGDEERGVSGEQENATAEGGAGSIPGDGAAWRDREVGELDVADYIVGSLYRNEIETLGQLATFFDGGQEVSSLHGIGEKSADVLVDAWTKYKRDHPEIDA